MKGLIWIICCSFFLWGCSNPTDSENIIDKENETPEDPTENPADNENGDENEDEDVSEGQTNWTKYAYWDRNNDPSFQYANGELAPFEHSGINDIAIRGEDILMVGQLSSQESSGIIWKSGDAGKTWKIVGGGGCGAGSAILDVAMPSTKINYALGYCLGAGKLFKSEDGGDTWIDIVLPIFVEHYTISKPMHFFDENHGIIGDIQTRDGGDTWTNIEDLKEYTGHTGSVFSIYFIDAQLGFCNTNNAILKTENGGENWSAVYEDPEATFRDIYFIDSEIGFVTTDSELLKTKDGGQSWSTVFSGIVRDISFATDQIGFLAGAGGIFKTLDKGNIWTLNYETNFINLSSCCLYHEVDGFNAVEFAGPELGIAAGFQNKNRNPDDDNLPYGKAYLALTTTLGE